MANKNKTLFTEEITNSKVEGTEEVYIPKNRGIEEGISILNDNKVNKHLNAGRKPLPEKEKKIQLTIRIDRQVALTMEALARIKCKKMIDILESGILELATKEDPTLLNNAKQVLIKEDKQNEKRNKQRY